jgi:hypothetical protein
MQSIEGNNNINYKLRQVKHLAYTEAFDAVVLIKTLDYFSYSNLLDTQPLFHPRPLFRPSILQNYSHQSIHCSLARKKFLPTRLWDSLSLYNTHENTRFQSIYVEAKAYS